MITVTKISDKRYDVYQQTGKDGKQCVGDFTFYDGAFRFYPIMFRYNTDWTAELMHALASQLDTLNKKQHADKA